MANKRNIDFYCSRGSDLSLDKSRFLDEFEKIYGISQAKMAFVGDDYFDFSMFEKLKHTFSPSDAPAIIKKNSYHVLQSAGGQGVVVELYDYAVETGWVKDAAQQEVAELDKLEASSKDMS